MPDDKYNSADDVLKDRGIQLLDMFDEGGFAKVFKARRVTEPNQLMACKMVDIGTDLSDNAKLSDVKNELFVLEKIKHPHIVRMYEHFIINEQLYIFMDYADFGNLYRYMYLHQGPMNEDEAKKPFSQIVSGVAYMHSKKIAHRDLKLSNILLKTLPDGNFVILIADFGLSRVVYRRKTGLLACKSYCGTPNYMAPELKQRCHYNAFDIDMYALGVMLFVVVQAGYPFDAQDDKKALEQAIKQKPDIQWNNDSKLSDSCHALICGLLEPSASKRMSMRDLIAHPWFAKEMQAIKHTLPPVDELPEKVATRKFSSPADDIRLRAQPSSADRCSKPASGSKRVKSADKPSKRVKSADKRSIKSTKSGSRKSAPSKNTSSRKKSADRSATATKRKPKSVESRESRTKSNSKQRQATIGKTHSNPANPKTAKTSSFSCSVKGSNSGKEAKD